MLSPIDWGIGRSMFGGYRWGWAVAPLQWWVEKKDSIAFYQYRFLPTLNLSLIKVRKL
ncbi:MAG: hypothetical protein WBA24_04435 [Geitlerinemataceae cyanobacterium]